MYFPSSSLSSSLSFRVHKMKSKDVRWREIDHISPITSWPAYSSMPWHDKRQYKVLEHCVYSNAMHIIYHMTTLGHTALTHLHTRTHTAANMLVAIDTRATHVRRCACVSMCASAGGLLCMCVWRVEENYYIILASKFWAMSVRRMRHRCLLLLATSCAAERTRSATFGGILSPRPTNLLRNLRDFIIKWAGQWCKQQKSTLLNVCARECALVHRVDDDDTQQWCVVPTCESYYYFYTFASEPNTQPHMQPAVGSELLRLHIVHKMIYRNM